jgi:hypothetical protein
VGLLALIAGTVSYLHMHTLVALHGQPVWVAALTPLLDRQGDLSSYRLWSPPPSLFFRGGATRLIDDWSNLPAQERSGGSSGPSRLDHYMSGGCPGCSPARSC